MLAEGLAAAPVCALAEAEADEEEEEEEEEGSVVAVEVAERVA